MLESLWFLVNGCWVNGSSVVNDASGEILHAKNLFCERTKTTT